MRVEAVSAASVSKRAPAAGHRERALSTAGLAVVGLSLLAFCLRLVHIDQSLSGDELFTYRIARIGGLGDVLEAVHKTSITPPLHYVLAWVSVKVGDPTVSIRLPSLVLGTATVPAVYLLGRRTVGSPGALVASALIALSPFAIFYSTEARAYGTLMLLVAGSTLLLLLALERGGRWWLAYAACSCLVLYAHYTGVFVIAAQSIWAGLAHRDRVRALLLSSTGIALGYLPWLPSFLNQSGNPGRAALHELSANLTLGSISDVLIAVFPGRPFVPPEALVLIAIGLVAALVGLALRIRRGEDLGVSHKRFGLVAALALATPVGVLAYSAAADNILGPRNLAASLPAIALLVGWLVMAGGRLAAPVAGAMAVAGLAVGTGKTFDADHRRLPLRDAAHFVDAAARPGDAVVQVSSRDPSDPLSRDLVIHFDRAHRFYLTGEGDGQAWVHGGRVFLVRPQLSGFFAAPATLAGDRARRFRLERRRVFAGRADVEVYVYSPRRAIATTRLVSQNGRESIVLPSGREIDVVPGAIDGYVEEIDFETGLLYVSGWATDTRLKRVVDRVLMFVEGRILASASPSQPRPDIMEAHGRGLRRSGYELMSAGGSPAQLRVFAVERGTASELKRLKGVPGAE